jgi:hypothetical protein
MKIVLMKIVLTWAAALAFMCALLLPEIAVAGDNSAALTFLQSVGCSQLPMGSCEALDADNAQNIMATYRAVLLQRFCGFGNVNEARIALQTGNADQPAECRELLNAIDGR